MEIFILVTGYGRKKRKKLHLFSSVVLTGVVKEFQWNCSTVELLPDIGSLLAIISILVILLLHNDIIKVGILRTENSGSFMGVLVVH